MARSIFVTESSTLQDFLCAAFPDVKRTKLKQWLKFGSVLVNGEKQTRHDHLLVSGDAVEIRSKEESMAADLLPPSMRVVHEDESLLVIDKPADLLSIASVAEREKTTYSYLTTYVRRGDPRSTARVWIVHRLDRETSGLMVFARTEAAKSVLQKNWDAVEKKYLAVVEGHPKKESGTLESFLDERNPHHVQSVRESEHTRRAVTRFQVMRHTARLTLVELTLVTGRRHQIRVQLSEIGCPVIGDQKYGARSDPAGRLGLHACSLRLMHPDSGEEMEFHSALPAVLAQALGSNNERVR